MSRIPLLKTQMTAWPTRIQITRALSMANLLINQQLDLHHPLIHYQEKVQTKISKSPTHFYAVLTFVQNSKKSVFQFTTDEIY